MTEILSTVYAATAPTWLGVYLHSPAAPAGTEALFLFGNIGRAESLAVDRAVIRLVGRALPIVESGEGENLELALSVVIPWGPDHDQKVQWWRDRVRARATLCYRDGRKRLIYISLGAVTVTDEKVGSTISATTTAVDFSEVV